MILSLFRFIKIEHTLFSLPIVAVGVLLGIDSGASWNFTDLWWIFCATTAARAAGFGLNRILDRDIDALNPRTKNRELPSGVISLNQAKIFTALMCLLFLLSAAMLSKTCLLLAPISLFLFWIYPQLKRYTLFAHIGLGLAWGVAPLGGWLGISKDLQTLPIFEPLLFALFSLFWVSGFDILYALLDEEFDRQHKLYSIPARLGKFWAIEISQLLHCAAFITLGYWVYFFAHQPLVWVLWCIIGMLFFSSHYAVSSRSLSSQVIDFAFFKVNAAIGFLILFLVLSRRFF